MNYQILALDLDGTLTNSSKEISEPTLKALIEIQEQGKKVVLASGRPTNGVAPLAEQLRLGDYGSYILSFNGGRITNCQTKEIIYNKTLPMDCAKPIYDMVLEYKDQGLDLVTYTPDALISGICPNKYTELESRINHMPIIRVDDFLSHIKEAPNKFLITGDSAVISKIQKKIITRFRSYLSVYCSDPFFLEIMPSGIDKAHSLLRLLTSSGLTADDLLRRWIQRYHNDRDGRTWRRHGQCTACRIGKGGFCHKVQRRRRRASCNQSVYAIRMARQGSGMHPEGCFCVPVLCHTPGKMQ
mgnify:CR=1 FL=1